MALTPRQDLSQLFRRTAIRTWNDVHPMFGDRFYNLAGQRINRGEGGSSPTARMPAVLDNRQSVLGDLIPVTSFGSSLANLLTRASWDKLRHPLIEANHNICQCCGQWRKSLDVHEIWGYDFPPEEDIAKGEANAQSDDDVITVCIGLQRLEGLMGLCKDCHACFHVGRANVHGNLDGEGGVGDRIRALNNWDDDTLQRYLNAVFERGRQASRLYWVLDFSGISHPDGGLTVDNKWRLSPHGGGMLVTENPHIGESNTAILGAPWRFAGEKDWRPSQSISDFE